MKRERRQQTQARKGKEVTDTEEAPEEERRKRQARPWERKGFGTILQETKLRD